jgi:(4S)-4-hydroxy-5-phosphonooxypentane-2,3-dione isomerase
VYIVCARLRVKAGEEETMRAAMRELVPASRAEPGCLGYVAHADTADPRRFMFYEQYVDEDAFKAHQASDHYQRLVVGVIAPTVEERERGVYIEVV